MEAGTYTARNHLSRLLDQVERGEEEPAAPRPIVVGLLRRKFPRLPTDMGGDAAWQDIIQIMEQGKPPQR